MPGRKSLLKPWIQSPNDPVFRNTDEFYRRCEAERRATSRRRGAPRGNGPDETRPTLKCAATCIGRVLEASRCGTESAGRLEGRGASLCGVALRVGLDADWASRWSRSCLTFLLWRCSLIVSWLPTAPIVPFFESPFAAGWSLEHEVFYTRPDQPGVRETKIYSHTARTELPLFACGDPRNVTAEGVARVQRLLLCALASAQSALSSTNAAMVSAA
jgi:hypothetical protein